MDDEDRRREIKEIYSAFKSKIGDIINRKRLILKAYRSKLEEAKVREIKESLDNMSK